MLKLYKCVDGRLHYHEAWSGDDEIIEHWGEVGSCGDRRSHPLTNAAKEDEAIENVLREARKNGFDDLAEDDLDFLIIEFKIPHDPNASDLDKRHELENRMNELLGWTGLGHCDGGSIGSGSMEVACMVVDVDIAKRVISEDLVGTTFADYSRIYVE